MHLVVVDNNCTALSKLCKYASGCRYIYPAAYRKPEKKCRPIFPLVAWE